MSRAYYNEIDPYAAQWLRNLIAAGHIAPGDVDERSIADVKATELAGYTQCHFFAGIGVWSHALRRAGWPDDQPVWTGSCPCQPFSAAGKQAGFDDARHLWPVWFGLIAECRPPVVLGEQVASALDWLDLVSTDMEGAGYAFGASDLCAAGFGGAHIRQRLYFAGTADAAVSGQPGPSGGSSAQGVGTAERCGAGGLADHDHERQPPASVAGLHNEERDAEPRSSASRLANPEGAGRGFCDTANERAPNAPGNALANSDCGATDEQQRLAGERPYAPLLGRDAADWLFCRDGKWRPVEPGTFPLADAAPARVGRLRAYGNGLDAETATQFVGAVMECLP